MKKAKPKKWATSLSLPLKYKVKVERAAKASDRPNTWVFKEALDQYLVKDKAKK